MLSAQMQKAQQATAAPNNLKVYRDQMKQVKNLRDGYFDPKTKQWVAGFNEMAMATGRFGVETVKTVSATESLTNSIQKQKLTFGQAVKNMKVFRAAWREQAALQQATAMQWTGGLTGKSHVDMYVPKGVGKDLDRFRIKYGYINEAIKSVAHQTVNWGKNTQWAGRQLTVGIGYPLALIAAGAAKLFYDADKQLTRIQKVYDFEQVSSDPKKQAASQATEAQNLRNQSLRDGVYIAKTYGQALKDTLALEADLAATGLKGVELQKTVEQVTRISTLGELDHNTALDMTITLMSTLKQKAADLTNTFNYMNAIENATSLTTQDFATALPRMAGALSGLGTSVEEMGVLMTAMKEGGVEAAQGANALKSATTRLLKPTHAATSYFQGFGIVLEDIVARAGGNLFDTLRELGSRMQGMTDIQKQQGIATLFGTYQFNRLNVVLSNLSDITNGNLPEGLSQTKKAFDIMNQSAAEWAATADQELMTAAQSASGRFKRIVEGIKAEMASMGEPILEALLPIVGFIEKLIKAFNNMPDFGKKFLLWAAVALGVAGPLIMLIGLMGNMTGQAAKLVTGIAGLGLRFKSMTKEQRANELLARRATSAFNSEASSVSKLTLEMQNMLKVLEAQARAQEQAALMAGGMSAAQARAATALRNPNTGQFESQQAQYLRLQQEAAKEANKTKVSMTGAVTALSGLAMGVMAIKNMSNGTNSMLEDFINISLIVASLQMTGLSKGLMMLFQASTYKRMGTAMTGIFAGVVTKSKAIKTAIFAAASNKWLAMKAAMIAANTRAGALVAMLKAAFGPIGWIAIGAGLLIAALVIWLRKMDQAQKRQDAINESAKKYADIMGFEYKAGSLLGGAVDPDTQAGRLDLVEKWKKELPELVTALKEAKKEGKDFAAVYNLAIREAVKAGTHGASAGNMRQVFQTALQAAGLDEVQIDDLSVQYDALKIENVDDLRRSIQNQLNYAANDIDLNIHLGDNARDVYFSDDIKAQLSEVGRLLANQLIAAGDEADVASDAMRNFRKQVDEMFNQGWDEWFNSLDKGFQDKLTGAGIDSISELQQYMDENPGVFSVELGDQSASSSSLLGNLQAKYREAFREILDELKQEGLLTQEKIDELLDPRHRLNFDNMAKGMNAGYLSLKDAMDGYADAMSRAWSSGRKLSDEEQLAILNTWRRKRGLKDATSLTQGFGAAMKSAAEDAADLAAALNVDLSQPIITAEQSTNFLRDSFRGAADIMLAQAQKIASAQQQAEQDAIQRRGDRQDKALEKRGKAEDKYYDERKKALEAALDAEEKAFNAAWDAREKQLEDERDAVQAAADAKIEAIQAEIDALEQADAERQKLFEREKTRISRLAELYNNNIDFNAALNTGKLDEAAKIYSNNSATVAGWAMEDQNAVMEDELDKRRKALQASIDLIEKEKDARLDALAAQKDALKELRQQEEEAMRARKDAALEQLQLEKEAAKERLDAEKEANRQAVQDAIARNKKIYDDKELKLEQELNAIKASTPRTMAEYQDQITRIEKAYSAYGVDLQKYGTQWGDVIGTALEWSTATAAEGLQNDIGWAQMGAYISSKIGEGTGLTMEAIKTFLSTGKFPTDAAPSSPTPYTVNAQRKDMESRGYTSLGNGRWRAPGGGVIFEHDGGHVGNDAQYGNPSWSQADRVGVPRSANLFPSEYNAILKHGEFVVNARDARKNLGLLKAINSGTVPAGDPGQRGVNVAQYLNGLERGREMGIYHSGGLVDATAGVAAAYAGPVLLQVQDMVAREAALQMMARASGSADMNYIGQMSQGINKVLAVARAQQGKPYIWGGAGAAGSDCSGFMSIIQNAVYGLQPPYGRRWATASFAGGKEIDGWKRGGGPSNVFRIGVDPNSHVAGTLAGINVESGSGHGPMVGGRALGAGSNFRYQYYLPAADRLPQLRAGGRVKYDNTLANLHKGETVLTAPLTDAFKDNVASGYANEYNVTIDLRGAYIKDDVDIEKAVEKALEKREFKNGRKRTIN